MSPSVTLGPRAPRREALRPRVFLGLFETAGYYRGLKGGFEELGVASRFVDLRPHPFGYAGYDANVLAEVHQFLRAHGGTLGRHASRVPRWMLFLWALASFDVFIFSGRESLLASNRDLPVLKRAGKKIIFQFHGTDSRPPFLDGAFMARDRGMSIADGIAGVRVRKEALARIERFADAVVNIPPQAHFQTKPFVLWLKVGLPTRPLRVPTLEELERPRSSGPIRALHSPSHPEAKGTREIEHMIERLRASGIDITLETIRNRPNHEVLEALERADLVVDQLYSDYAMPGFATEASWFGKPAVVGGYAVELWSRLLHETERPPTLYRHPDQVEASIRELALDEGKRRQLGRAARRFVEEVWSPRRVAERYLRIASEGAPRDWMYDPRDIDYWQGCAAPESRIRDLIKSFVEIGGREALGLEDKPALEAKLVAMISSTSRHKFVTRGSRLPASGSRRK